MIHRYAVNMPEGWAAIGRDVLTLTREQCIALLQWNDPNGCYTDEASIREGYAPMTTDEARERLESVARFNSLN